LATFISPCSFWRCRVPPLFAALLSPSSVCHVHCAYRVWCSYSCAFFQSGCIRACGFALKHQTWAYGRRNVLSTLLFLFVYLAAVACNILLRSPPFYLAAVPFFLPHHLAACSYQTNGSTGSYCTTAFIGVLRRLFSFWDGLLPYPLAPPCCCCTRGSAFSVVAVLNVLACAWASRRQPVTAQTWVWYTRIARQTW